MPPLSSFTAAAILALAATVAGCNPIETYRDVRGINKNDPDPATAPFSGNIAAADAAPYPNLASVPPPPTRATSTADRQKLTESLIAERTATEAAAAMPAPAPAAAPAPAKQAKPTPPVASTPPIAATAIAPAAAPPPVVVAPPAPPVAAAAPAPPPPVAPAPVASAPAPPPAAAEAVTSSGKQASKPPPPPRQFKGQPVDAPPMDSSLEMPQVRSRPEPEAVRPPLPPPSLARVAPPAAVAPTPPEAVASAAPAPPPPVPTLMPATAPPAPIDPPTRRAPTATTVATLGIAGATAAPDRAEIDRVATLYRERPGTVRVLAFAAAPTGGGDPLAGYHAALGRAQQIAKALADAGIPANKIQTEAAPSPLAAGRVDIQFAP